MKPTEDLTGEKFEDEAPTNGETHIHMHMSDRLIKKIGQAYDVASEDHEQSKMHQESLRSLR